MRNWNYRQPNRSPYGQSRQVVTFCWACRDKAPRDYERVCEAHRLDACDACGFPYDENGKHIDGRDD